MIKFKFTSFDDTPEILVSSDILRDVLPPGDILEDIELDDLPEDELDACLPNYQKQQKKKHRKKREK